MTSHPHEPRRHEANDLTHGSVDIPVDDATTIMAHELRGPLAIVTGYLDLIGRAPDTRTREYALGAAQRAVARMDALIDDVLTAANQRREEARALPPIDPLPVVRDLVRDVPVYEERVRLSVSSTRLVRADALRLGRALANVLDNAIKFSPPGSPIALSLVDHEGRVGLVVEDEGPGIPAPEADRLRQRFERLERDSAVPGFGIGLCVTADVVEAMGGEVVLGNRASEHGARVELWLPAAPAL